MRTVEGRFEVRLISSEALRSYMRFRGYTVRSLADRIGCSHSTVGFLTSGRRNTCRPEWATKIAKALDCPVESLFEPRVSRVVRDVRRSAA